MHFSVTISADVICQTGCIFCIGKKHTLSRRHHAESFETLS